MAQGPHQASTAMRNAHFASREGSTGVARTGPKIAHHKQLQHLPGLQGGREGCDTCLGTKAGDVSRPIVGKANKNPGRCAGLQHCAYELSRAQKAKEAIRNARKCKKPSGLIRLVAAIGTPWPQRRFVHYPRPLISGSVVGDFGWVILGG